MRKILILGAGGMLGRNLISALCSEAQIFALTRRPPEHKHPHVKWIETDILDQNKLDSIVRSTSPDTIINSAACVQVDECEGRQKATYDLHVGVTQVLCTVAKDLKSQFIYISTDSVFDGRKTGPYLEVDSPNPLNYYAETKLQGETEALRCDSSLVLRTNIFGWRHDGRQSFAEWVLDGLRTKKDMGLFRDVLFTPISTVGLSSLIKLAIETGITGLFHAGGAEILSKYQFANKVAEVYQLSTECIRSVSVDEKQFDAMRPKNMALNSSLFAQSLGVTLPSVMDSIHAWRKSREEK